MAAGLLIGTFERQLDAKGRLALPAEMRRRLGDSCYLVRGTERCVDVVPAEDFEREVADLLAAVRRGEREKNEQRALAGSASFAELDKQGRITLDDNLRTWAGLNPSEPLVVSGAFDRIEIWAKDRRDRIDARGAERLAGDE